MSSIFNPVSSSVTPTVYSLNQINAAQTKIDDIDVSIASDGKGEYFSSVENADLLISSQVNYETTTNFEHSNNVIKERLDFMSSQLLRLQQIAAELAPRVSQLLTTNVPPDPNFGNNMTAYLGLIENILNNQFNGQYTLGGTDITNAPIVNLQAMPYIANGSASIQDFSYYHGNGESLSYRVDQDTLLSFTVNAGLPSIEGMVRALRLLQNPLSGSGGVDTTRVGVAFDLLNDAVTNIGNDRATVNFQIQMIEECNLTLGDRQTSLAETIKQLGYDEITDQWMKLFHQRTQLSFARQASVMIAQTQQQTVDALSSL